jgi:hypothetical protein
MTKRHKILLLTSGLIVTLVCWAFVRSDSEPSFGGKPLSKWAMKYGFNPTPQGEDKEAVAAIRHIGTNAIPTLLEWVQYQPTKRNPSLPKMLQYMRLLTSSTPFRPKKNEERIPYQYLAPSVFDVLGPQAKGAIPKLNQLMNSHNDPMVIRQAAFSLGFLGKHLGNEVSPLLIAALTNQQSCVRLAALGGIRFMGTNAIPVLPVLTQTLNDNDEKVARWAIMTLGKLKIQPEIAVPALIASMKDSRVNVRGPAAAYLAMFGTDAKPAVPELLYLFNNGTSTDRVNASNALFQIDPEALKRATRSLSP